MVSILEPMWALEIINLDCFTNTVKIEEVIKRYSQGEKMVIVTVPANTASQLLHCGKEDRVNHLQDNAKSSSNPQL